MSSAREEKLQASPQLSTAMFLQGDAELQASQAEMNPLPLATECSLAAALTQLLSLASLCVAVSFVRWILLFPIKTPKIPEIKSSASFVLGVPYKVEVVNLENITTEECKGALSLGNQWGGGLGSWMFVLSRVGIIILENQLVPLCLTLIGGIGKHPTGMPELSTGIHSFSYPRTPGIPGCAY